ncbi:MAG: rod shape-determining protein MreC [Sulfurospirillaceae bacterium]|nr:rod shape-determining protein MreC [Sulfurospirillaceae bacterium]
MNKIKLLFVLVLLIYISTNYTDIGRKYIMGLNHFVLTSYLNTKEKIKEKINEHVSQQHTIIQLREKNKKLEKSALLSIAFAGKLNAILADNNLSVYKPSVKMIQAISYANLNDYNKVWLDYKDFNKSKIYGLLYQGYAAGIAVAKDSNPLGLLLGDSKCIFSVYVGKKKIPGVLQGNKKDILVKYIPLWMNPKIGDEVLTSGLDNIFFQGVRVGKVVEVVKEESSKTLIVQPYVNVKIPTYLHIITKN